MIKILLQFVLIFSSVESFAKLPVKRKLASNENIEVSVIYGDNVSHITVEKKNSDIFISMKSNSSSLQQRKLADSDYSYIVDEFSKLETPEQIPTTCYRNRVDMIYAKDGVASEKKSSCYGLNTKSEPSFARFIKILGLAI